MSQLTHGSFFDGFGGLRRGLEDAGMRTIWKRDLLYGNDITSDDPRELERVDVISGRPVAACQLTGYKTEEEALADPGATPKQG